MDKNRPKFGYGPWFKHLAILSAVAASTFQPTRMRYRLYSLADEKWWFHKVWIPWKRKNSMTAGDDRHKSSEITSAEWRCRDRSFQRSINHTPQILMQEITRPNLSIGCGTCQGYSIRPSSPFVATLSSHHSSAVSSRFSISLVIRLWAPMTAAEHSAFLLQIVKVSTFRAIMRDDAYVGKKYVNGG